MIVWLSRVGEYYYRVTWENKQFVLASCGKNEEWEREREGTAKGAIHWIVNSDLDNDVIIGETAW